ncbi:MAG: AAA family ATPase [Sandaracinaceae bacterium]|nr:AAA family ATPase [Sandaracinaceae bacterium]
MLAGEGRVLEGVAVEPEPEVLERAAALLAQTEAGEIRVSGALEGELGRDFRLRRRGPDDADVVVDGFRSRRDRDAGAMRVRAPLVGRRDVLRTLSGVLADTARGSGALVHLVGEPSVGKSRLLAELRAAAAPKDFIFVHGRADEADAERSFGALGDLVSDLCGLEPEDTPAQRFEKVERMRVLGLAPREVRLLGELIGLAYPLASVERAGRPRGIEIALALRRALRTLADDRVVVLALEDLHWMDDATRQVLPLLVHGLTRARVLVLLTRRPGSSGPLPRGRTLEVPPLEVEAAGRLLAHWLGARAVEPELAELVHRETGASPPGSRPSPSRSARTWWSTTPWRASRPAPRCPTRSCPTPSAPSSPRASSGCGRATDRSCAPRRRSAARWRGASSAPSRAWSATPSARRCAACSRGACSWPIPSSPTPAIGSARGAATRRTSACLRACASRASSCGGRCSRSSTRRSSRACTRASSRRSSGSARARTSRARAPRGARRARARSPARAGLPAPRRRRGARGGPARARREAPRPGGGHPPRGARRSGGHRGVRARAARGGGGPARQRARPRRGRAPSALARGLARGRHAPRAARARRGRLRAEGARARARRARARRGARAPRGRRSRAAHRGPHRARRRARRERRGRGGGGAARAGS